MIPLKTNKEADNSSIEELQDYLANLTDQEIKLKDKLAICFDNSECAAHIKQNNNGQYPINPDYISCLIFFNSKEAQLHGNICYDYNITKTNILYINELIKKRKK